MNRTLNVSLFMAALGLAALLPSASSASGWLRRGCGGCETAQPAPCVTTVAKPPEIRYEERVVTRYKPVTKEKEVTCVVPKLVPRDCVKTVMVPYTIKEKRCVTELVPVWREVDACWTEMVSRVIKEKVTKTVTERRVHAVDDFKTVCRLVPTTCVDECGRCYTKYERVTETVPIKRHVVECYPVVREFEVTRVECDRVERKGKRKVCDLVRQEKEIEVHVVRCRPEERVFKVYDCVPETVTRKVTYCEMVPYQETIRVPVCVTPPCETSGCCGSRRIFGGLFNRCN